MTPSEYLNSALRTWAQRSAEDRLFNAALGISGEVGEVVEVIKKFLYHGKTQEETRSKLLGELGDLFYYIFIYAHERRWNMHDPYSWTDIETAARMDEKSDDLFAVAMRLSATSGRLSELLLYFTGFERNDSASGQDQWFVRRLLQIAIIIGEKFGISAEEIAEYNIAKLRSRHPH